jgi:hypothetical protein
MFQKSDPNPQSWTSHFFLFYVKKKIILMFKKNYFTLNLFIVTGTPVNFGGMTGSALAVILKLNF